MAFTPIWGSGFEMGSLPSRNGVATSSNVAITTSPHAGSYAILVGAVASGGEWKIVIDSLSELYVGTWVKSQDGSSSIYNAIIIGLSDGSTVRLALVGTWNYYIDTTLTQAGTITPNASQWHNVQIHVSGSIIETRIDGCADVVYNTGLAASITSVKFYGPSGNNNRMYYDDISIGTGGWPGDIRYDVLYPTADTAVHAWLPNGVSLQAAPAAPTVGVTTGPGLTGDYHYKITLVDTDGETLGGTASALVQPSNQVVALSGIPTGLEGTTARKIYRTAAGGSTYKLVATLSDNTTTTYNDSLADGSLGAAEPTNVHYDKIDERPASDSDYIYIATNGAQDLHALSAWDATKKLPLYLVQWARALKDTADSQQLKLLLKSGVSSTLKTSSAHDLLTSAGYEFEIHTTNPDGAAWTDAEIEALQAGVEAVVP